MFSVETEENQGLRILLRNVLSCFHFQSILNNADSFFRKCYGEQIAFCGLQTPWKLGGIALGLHCAANERLHIAKTQHSREKQGCWLLKLTVM